MDVERKHLWKRQHIQVIIYVVSTVPSGHIKLQQNSKYIIRSIHQQCIDFIS